MPSKTAVAIITADPKVVVACEAELKSSYKTIPYLQPTTNGRSVRDFLKRAINEILGVSDGNILTEAVVTDAIFRGKNQEPYFVGDPLFEGLPDRAGSLLSMILGAGLPVVVNPNTKDFSEIWRVGDSGARYYAKGRLIGNVRKLLNQRKFNVHTLEVENEFASIYDSEELSGAATVSAIIWENEYVRHYVNEHLQGSSNRARILDLGTGTGRFEEVILSDDAMRSKIESITAIDFAPMYLVKAKERLPGILSKSSLNKICFLRRVAEDLHWPDNYFDIVIAGFGITCFSQFHLTLPEIHRVLKPGGLAIMNGYNRSAITFDFEELMKQRVGQPASHFAIRIDREENLMHLGTQVIQCFTFNVDDLQVLLKLVRFKPIRNSMSTFPALYGSARKEYLKRLSGRNDESQKPGPRRRRKTASYQRMNLISDQFNSGFNEVLHMMDSDLAAVLNDRGFYFCIAMHK